MGQREAEKIRSGLEALLRIDGGSTGRSLGRLLDAYLDDDAYLDNSDEKAPRFAGRHFGTLGENPPEAWTSDDLLALALLDVPPPRQAVVEILLLDESNHDFTKLLAAIPSGRDLWDASDAELEACTALWQRLREIRGLGWVRAHKLIARKRPRLHPIYDGVVKTWFQDSRRRPSLR